ncbi:hypothetical protein GQ457_03G028660 [Hibiscus cannabinus]
MVTMSLFQIQTYFTVIPGQRAGRKQWLSNKDHWRVANGWLTNSRNNWNFRVNWMDSGATSKTKVIVLFISGDDDDPLCPVNVLGELEKIVGKGSKVVIFERRGHAFAYRPGSLAKGLIEIYLIKLN